MNHERGKFHARYAQYAERDGQGYVVLHKITEPDATHDEEVLPMYRVRFDDGFEEDIWPEELGEE